MKLRVALSAVVACLLACSSALAAPVTDNVVFGNLGSTASGPITGAAVGQVGSTNVGMSGNAFAVPFVTGSNSDYLKLTSVLCGFGDVPPENDAIVNLVSDASGPTGTILASAQQTLGPNGKYTFNMGLVPLQANTTYWVTVAASDAASGNFFNWLSASGGVVPGEQNGSGYSFPGSYYINVNGSGWGSDGDIPKLAISVQAVPEPSTYVLAAVGLGLAGYVRARRRKPAV